MNALCNTREFRSALLRWYRKNGRNLPWRKTRDPYAILVSEVMLQQTQVASVKPYYDNWFRRFPDFNALAGASENDVLHAWQGLGYYARARNLRAAAKVIVKQHGGNCPREIDSLRALPGIGRYTANAVLTFAFDRSVPIVEANVARLLSRLFNITTTIDSSTGRARLWDSAARLVPDNDAAAFNSALIDLGAMVCLPQKPKCNVCPVKKFCRAPRPELLPRKRKRPKVTRLTEAHAFTIRQRRILLERAARRWRGMWILPPLNACHLSGRAIHTSTFPFTHHHVTLDVFRQRPRNSATNGQRWFAFDELKSIPIPSPHRRAIDDLVCSPLSVGRPPRRIRPSAD